MPFTLVHPTMQMALCWFDTFRRLGYPADDIYLVVGADPHLGPSLFVMVRANDREFTCAAGPWAQAAETIQPQWEEACSIWNHTTSVQHSRLMERTMQPGFTVPFITALVQKGVYPHKRTKNTSRRGPSPDHEGEA